MNRRGGTALAFKESTFLSSLNRRRPLSLSKVHLKSIPILLMLQLFSEKPIEGG